MSNGDIGERVRDWQAKLAIISRNMTDLAESGNTNRIRARLRNPSRPYLGQTAVRAKAAFAAMDELWQDYLMLARVVEEAADLASKNGIFRNTGDEVRELLEGLSVKLPSVHIPLPARDLLTEAERSDRACLAEVLNAMQTEFATARDVLAGISDAEARFASRMAAISEEAKILERRGVALGSPCPTKIAISQSVSDIEADPLGCSMQADRLEASLREERARLDTIEQEREKFRAALEHARASLSELKDLAQRSRSAITETRLKIAAPHAFAEPIAAEVMTSLGSWLDTLEETFGAGRLSAAKVGISRWEKTCAAHLVSERDVLAKNRAALDERAELRGRFEALRVKARTFAQRGVVLGEKLEQMEEETSRILEEHPFVTDAGRRIVSVYAAALTAKISRNPDKDKETI